MGSAKGVGRNSKIRDFPYPTLSSSLYWPLYWHAYKDTHIVMQTIICKCSRVLGENKISQSCATFGCSQRQNYWTALLKYKLWCFMLMILQTSEGWSISLCVIMGVIFVCSGQLIYIPQSLIKHNQYLSQYQFFTA